MSVVFRWGVWGEVSKASQLLLHSVGTFRRWFGPAARYVICTDQPGPIKQLFGGSVEIVSMDKSPFNVAAHAPWKKWGPAVRLFPGDVEIHIDADVFAVGDPYELRQFCEMAQSNHCLIMRESRPEAYYGLFEHFVEGNPPPLNTGIVAQHVAADLTEGILEKFEWWRKQVGGEMGDFYDEQGAVASVLAPLFARGQVQVLPPERYMIVSPRSNVALKDLSGIAVIHTTWPNHPGFEWFREQIIANSECA